MGFDGISRTGDCAAFVREEYGPKEKVNFRVGICQCCSSAAASDGAHKVVRRRAR